MGISKLNAFFRTQLTFDQPVFFNSITNLALAPLQRLIGHNQFQSLNGKVTYLPQGDYINEQNSFAQLQGDLSGAEFNKLNMFDPSQSTPLQPPYFTTLFKVVVFVCNFFVAIVLTPIGITARCMSFRSPQIDRAYSITSLLQLGPGAHFPGAMESACAFMQKMPEKERNELIDTLPDNLALSYLSLPSHWDFAHAFLSQCPLTDRTEILKKLPPSVQVAYLKLDANAKFAEGYLREVTQSEYLTLVSLLPIKLINIYEAQKSEKEKKQALDTYLKTAIQSLEQLKNGLQLNEPQDELRSDSSYPFPFYFAQALENNPEVTARADKELWGKFLSLKQSCLTSLPPDCDEVLLQTTQAEAIKSVKAAFTPNARFFNDLKTKLKSEMETSDIKDWIEKQKKLTTYFYPFYTQPIVLELMIQQTTTPDKVKPFSEAYSACLGLLRERNLEEYINEKPDQSYSTVKAINQLENISKLQNLIKNQTAENLT